MTQLTMLYLDDLHPGMRFITATATIDAEQITKFAREFDPQPFHLSDEAARSSLFDGLSASGWHTAALTMRLLVDSNELAGGIIGGGGEMHWPRPTRPGDTLQVHGEVVAVTPSRSKPDRGIVTIRNETRNQHGEAVQIFVAKLVVPRRRPEADNA
jgi:acyl dehydratase